MGHTWAAGIVNYRSYDDLERCVASLAAQSLPPETVLVIDVDGDPEQRARFEGRVPRGVTILDAPNRGYAGGANRALHELSERGASDFLLLLNPDVELEPGFADRLVDALSERPGVAIAGGKLLRRDVESTARASTCQGIGGRVIAAVSRSITANTMRPRPCSRSVAPP